MKVTQKHVKYPACIHIMKDNRWSKLCTEWPSRRWQDNIARKEGTTWNRKATDRGQWKALMENYNLQWITKPRHRHSYCKRSLYFYFQQMRVRVLQSYVKDLSEQNEVLVTTVEELEQEANDRVTVLEDKLHKASISVKVGHSLKLF